MCQGQGKVFLLFSFFFINMYGGGCCRCTCLWGCQCMGVPVKVRGQPPGIAQAGAVCFIWDRISHWSGACQVGLDGCPVSPRTLPTSTSPALGLQGLTTTSFVFLGRRRTSSGSHTCKASAPPSVVFAFPFLGKSSLKEARPHLLRVDTD